MAGGIFLPCEIRSAAFSPLRGAAARGFERRCKIILFLQASPPLNIAPAHIIIMDKNEREE